MLVWASCTYPINLRTTVALFVYLTTPPDNNTFKFKMPSSKLYFSIENVKNEFMVQKLIQS